MMKQSSRELHVFIRGWNADWMAAQKMRPMVQFEEALKTAPDLEARIFFAAVVLLCDDYLTLKALPSLLPSSTERRVINRRHYDSEGPRPLFHRGMAIIRRLPMELQIQACYAAFEQATRVITQHKFEEGLTWFLNLYFRSFWKKNTIV